MDDNKEGYDRLKKRHSLPDYDAVDDLFEISSIESHRFLLRDIRRQMISKVKANTEILEELIHPNSTISSYHEFKFFNDDEKKGLYDLYAKLMECIRRSNILDIESSDEAEAGFIKDVYSKWQGLREKLSVIMMKLRDSWSKEEIADTDTSSYFG